MEKYIGNKSSLLRALGDFIQERAPKARSVSDLFTGTTNVSRYFRVKGFDVTTGDTNRFSYVLAQAYIGMREYPQFEFAARAVPLHQSIEHIQREFYRAAKRFEGCYIPVGSSTELWSCLRPFAIALAYLQETSAKNTQPGPIIEYYTRWGERSRFVSVRGRAGKRNYFSKQNGLFLDGALKSVRRLWREGKLTRIELFLLLTSILEEVCITANVNGTFHDFNRTRLWPNANQSFFLRMPLIHAASIQTEILNDDALSAASYVRPHDICYVDPPYNFRQYTSYYHFLNFIAAYPFLSRPADYLQKLNFVRGQNMNDDHTSVFCFREQFIESMRTLFERINAKYIVLSYYGGRNHWNHWSTVTKPTDKGFRALSELFADGSLFTHGEAVRALDVRLNYQSRGGEQKSLVDEYLFFGVKKSRSIVAGNGASAFKPNRSIGVVNHFSYELSPMKELIDEETSTEIRQAIV